METHSEEKPFKFKNMVKASMIPVQFDDLIGPHQRDGGLQM